MLKKTPVTLAVLVAIGLAVSACGKVKTRDEQVVVVHDAAPSSSTNTQSIDTAFSQIKAFIQLYFDGAAVTKAGLTNLFEKYKDKIGKFLEGTKLTPAELIDLLFKFDSNHDGRLTPGELAYGLNRRIPILRWIPDNQAEITRDELDAALAQEFPDAEQPSRGLLGNMLMRFDEAWAGGNGDERLSRTELASAGLILGMLEGTDFSQGLQLPTGTPKDQQAAVDQLKNKLNEQVFGRYFAQGQIRSYTQLSPATQSVEWMALALKFYLIDRLVQKFGTDGMLNNPQQAEAFSTWGPRHEVHWAELRSFYDSKLMLGDGKSKYNTIESFNLLTDLNLAETLWAQLDGDFSSAHVKAARNRVYILTALETLYPTVGRELFSHSEYWDSLKEEFDEREHGGNADGHIDFGELTMALAYARIVDTIYATYDTDHDGKLSKAEAAPLFAQLNVTDTRMIDAFFAGIGLDGKDPSFWTKFKWFFSGAPKTHPLAPSEFHSRLVQILPQLQHPKPPKPRRGD